MKKLAIALVLIATLSGCSSLPRYDVKDTILWSEVTREVSKNGK